jgi:hypothetical protein
MYILYADDAGNTGTDYDNQQQPIFSLAGVIVDTDKWFVLNDLITSRRNEISPELVKCEIHATEIYNGKVNHDKGYNFRKNTLEENLNILERLFDLVAGLKLPVLMFMVRKCNLKNYCQSKFGMGIKIDPYLIAFPYVSLAFDYYIKTKSSNGMIFLDEQSALVNKVEDMLERLRLIESADSKIRIDRIIERALFLESAKSNFIQLADICNFYINRHLSIKVGVAPNEVKKQHIEKMYQKIEPLILNPIANPEELKEMLAFFEDNAELLGKK